MMKKMLSLTLALALCLGLTVPVFADAGTTTAGSASKDLNPRTEIYAVTKTPGSDYPSFGVKYEPNGGVLYGRTAAGGPGPDGNGWGITNLNQIQEAGESIVSYYYGLSEGPTLEEYSYIFTPALQGGSRALLVYINFDNEGSDCGPIVNGSYDSKLSQTFTYLNTLNCPIFIRIGGEVNVWDNRPKAADFIAAYRHIASLARAQAPRAALLFSPNYSSGNKVDMDVYYPGDEYVDWLGVSLYYDRWHHSGDTQRDKFYGVGDYGDALLNIQQVVNMSKLHARPIMVTEGGSCNVFKGQDNASWAADRMARAYSFLPMVYPEVKAIVSSDYGDSWAGIDYTFYNNPTVTAAYRQAVQTHPTLVHSFRDTGAYYTKLSAYGGKWEGTMSLAAYTWSPDKLSATWSVDGQAVATANDYPYAFNLDTTALATGEHTVSVTFSNGASKSYQFQTTAPAILASNGAQVDGWAKTHVNAAITAGLISEKLGSDYRSNITRAQFAATAVKLFEAMAPNGEKIAPAATNPFTDTDDPDVLRAAAAGFVSGMGDGTFEPNTLVKREEAAAMLSRVYTKLGGEISAAQSTAFSDDGSISGWARDAVAFMSGKGIVSGSDGSFNPQGSATIQEALSIALRMFQNLK